MIRCTWLSILCVSSYPHLIRFTSSVLFMSRQMAVVSFNRGIFGEFFCTDSEKKMLKIACTENSNRVCNIWLRIECLHDQCTMPRHISNSQVIYHITSCSNRANNKRAHSLRTLYRISRFLRPHGL
jgi:hypothetical protein